ncbi:MAG: Rid family hydrolase, partial [Prosthecobacter sp.]|nr:Rid family hydrolase [Prosthecobacter sp.]
MPPEEWRMDMINDAAAVPKAVGPYSQAVRSQGFLFCSGQIPIDPASGKIEATEAEGQTRQVLTNIRALLES